MNDIERKHIFIAGLHRSGTTLLFELLREHPEISGFYFEHDGEKEHEGQYNQTVYPKDPDHGGAGYFAFDPDAHLDESSNLITTGNREQLFKEWSRYWDLTSQFLLEKSPPNIVRTRFLQSMFPQSHFIVILRHPIAASMATLKWMGWPRFVVEPADNSLESASNYIVRFTNKEDIALFRKSKRLFTESIFFTLYSHWLAAHQTLSSDRTHLRSVLMVKYEELTSRPQTVLDSICEFLSIENLVTPRLEDIRDENTKYFDRWSSLPSEEISSSGRLFLQETFSEPFGQYGYDFMY